MGFLFQLFHEALCDAVYTAHRRHHPYLVTHAHVAVLTYIAFKGAILFPDGKFFVDRLVCIFECAREVGLQVVLIHPVTSFQCLTGMTDGITVFDDVFALGRVLNQDLMSSRRVLVDGDLSTVHLDNLSFLLFRQTDHNRVCRINL